MPRTAKTKKPGAFERFFDSSPPAVADYWRARFFAGVGEGRSRTMLRAVKRAKREGGDEPSAFLEAFERLAHEDYERRPRERRAAALAWVERMEEIERQARALLRRAARQKRKAATAGVEEGA